MGEIRARKANAAELARWDELVAKNPAGGDFVQTMPYAVTKGAVGWRPRYLVFERDGVCTSVALVLERKIPLLGRYWYLPRGPAVSELAAARAHLAALLEFIKAHTRGIFAVTFEPPIKKTDADQDQTSLFAAQGAHWRPALQGNANTAIVELSDDATMLASFQKRCRNSISRAIRDGVQIREFPSNEATFAQMHRLMTLVGGGAEQTLRLRSHEYAERFWRAFSDAGHGKFYGIDVDGSPALLAYVIRVGEHAFYKDGGSERQRTSPGMSNLLQWHMMREMRNAGSTQYDLMGTPSKDRLTDQSSPNFSLASFKLSFAGEVTEFVGAYDLPLRRPAYRLWQRLGLPIAQRMHRRRYRDLDLY